MPKSLVLDFIGLYRALLKDCSVYLPQDRREFERDLTRVISLSSNRGDLCFTKDLPSLGKLLDKALSDGFVSFSGEPLSRSSHRKSHVPRLFRALWGKLFDDDGCLKQTIDPNVVAFLRTLLYVGKNFKSDCAPRYLFEATQEFYDVESHMFHRPKVWDGDGHNLNRTILGEFNDLAAVGGDQQVLPLSDIRYDSQLLDTLQRTADEVSSSFGWFDPAHAVFKHGPGAVAEFPRFGAYKYKFLNWAPRLGALFPYDAVGTTSLGVGDFGENGYDHREDEPASVLIAVPKTMKGPRLIAKEPACHQWVQQGIREFLYRKVEELPIGLSVTFRSQQPSRDGALQSSLTGRTATVDLKSASDRISCWVIQRLFRANLSLLEPMIASRTRFILNHLDKKNPAVHELKKFSTQGSALTFPVQSILFYVVCISVGRQITGDWNLKRLSRLVRIFGDDIIIPVEWEPRVRGLLHDLGLRVNDSKTHTKGNFRESCGMDAFMGNDVTPAYVLSSYSESAPGSLASIIDVANNFFSKGYWHASMWVESTIPHGLRKKIAVVAPGSGLSGLMTYGKVPVPRITRWNENLQRTEFRSIFVATKKGRLRHEGTSNLLQYFTERPAEWIPFVSGEFGGGLPVIREGWRDISLLG